MVDDARKGIIQKLYSLGKIGEIEIQRGIDLAWAKKTGAPALYRSQITHNLFLGGQYTLKGLMMMKSWGITAVVSMRKRKPAIFTQVDWLKVLHLPTSDGTAPKLPDLIRGVSFIKKEIDEDGKVYVHCWWGEGRGPTMAAAYLMSSGLTLEDALVQIRKVRTFIRPTKVQLAQLEKYSEFLAKNQ